MRILFIGNSITAGNTGVSFIRAIRKQHPLWKLVNKGINGEPLYNIAERLINTLKKDRHFDCIVIEAGINDVLLPELEKRGGLYRWAIGRERRHEIRPFDDPEKFKNFYTVLLREARIYTRVPILLINLSCINEGACPALLAKQKKYNEVIEQLAAQANYRLADVASVFANRLRDGNNSDYLCRSFWNTNFWDGIRCRFPGQAERLSKKRNLKLTIDGVHLNEAGAAIYASVIPKLLVP